MTTNEKLTGADVLIGVDIQNDFLPGGALAVSDGDEVIQPTNILAKHFVSQGAHFILTQDWHRASHSSFASRYGLKPFQTLAMPYGEQVLWPDHCIQGTKGAEIADALYMASFAELVIRKGFNLEVDSYSAFREADRVTQTGLAGYLRERGIKRLFCTGLATDFCVAWTALDAKAAGFDTYIVIDACRAINTNSSLANALREFQKAGVKLTSSYELLK